MIRYVIVLPHTRHKFSVTCETLLDAQRIAEIGDVDHGVLMPGLGYCVYEHALFVPTDKQAYCGIAGHLIAGPAVFYGFDEAGETIDLRLSEFPDVRWYLGVNDVEAAIERGEIERPCMAFNGAAFWQWPDPPPK
jgi:hypothetical protein